MTAKDSPPGKKDAIQTGRAKVINHPMVAEQGAGPSSAADYNLDSPDWYLNRELSWLQFNRRVLHEAQDPRTPLLERVRFLAIVSGNLDEFFMKRVGGLRNLMLAGHRRLSPDGLMPAQQLNACRSAITRIQTEREEVVGQVLRALRTADIGILKWADLSSDQQHQLRQHYIDTIFPVVTPLAMDPGHPFPFISNLALNLLATVRFPGEKDARLGRVKVPVIDGVASRLQQVGDSHYFVLLEDIMANNLDLLFPGLEIDSCSLFRVTRNARLELEEQDAEDLLEQIKTELESRRFQPIVRLQVDASMGASQRDRLAAELDVEASDVFDVGGMMSMRHLFQIANLDIPALRYPPHRPIDHPRLAQEPRKLFQVIRDGGPVLLQHPYESFRTSVERFLRNASSDPKVLAIKMTLYRTSAEGNIIQYLINAARNGKQVAVLVELQARFDEAANIRWARRLEEVGIHVTYGVVGLKTHTKLILVVRRDFDGIRRYAHIGTGNYHPGTATQYSDLGLLTCDADVGADISELFNYLTGYASPLRYRKVIVAPHRLKRLLLKKIERECRHAHADEQAHIRFKTNALEDQDITRALYEASQAGVKIELFVRDSCRLRPGIAGLSENVKVISTIGRFLEHSRVFYFRNAGDEEFYIGSADLMRRNLESRVEVVVPIDPSDADSREALRLMFNVQLADQRSAWDMQPDGAYLQRKPRAKGDELGAQELMIALAERRAKAARGRAKKPKKKYRKKDPFRFKYD